MQFNLEKILINGANSEEQLRALANALNLKINLIGSMHNLSFPLAKGNYIILITPNKKISNGHWVALKIGSGGSARALRSSQSKSYYFDSFGQPPPKLIELNIKNLHHNRTQIQALNQTHCGIYAIYFLKHGIKMLKHFRPLNIY